MSAYGAPQYAVYCTETTPISVTYSDRDANGRVSIGDAIDVPTADCGGVRGELSLTLTQLSSPPDRIAGRMQGDIEPDGMHIVGARDVSLNVGPFGAEWACRITNAVVTVTQTSTTQTVRLTSAQLAFTPPNYSLSVTGGSVESGYLGGN